MYLLIFLTILASAGFIQAELVPLSPAQKQEFVDVHNSWRAKASGTAMKKMKWNNDLAKFAEKVASRCRFSHSSGDERKNLAGFSYVGENLYATTGTAKPSDVVNNWSNEIQDYNLATNQCRAGKECGHYTQVVWASTSDIGCAVAKCNPIQGWLAGQVVFCDYGPGGNINGQRPYEKGAAGSKCQQIGMKKDAQGLCVK